MRMLVVILAVAGISVPAFWGLSRQAVHREGLPHVPGSYFERLRIERPGKSIAAPDFALDDLSGARVTLRRSRGKVVFLNFWATWCVPCRAEMPAMERLHRELKEQGLEILAVNLRENKRQVREFVEELGLTFTTLLDRDGEVSAQYGVWSLPLSYFIDRRGKFVGKAIGSRNWHSAASRGLFLELLGEGSQKTARPGERS